MYNGLSQREKGIQEQEKEEGEGWNMEEGSQLV